MNNLKLKLSMLLCLLALGLGSVSAQVTFTHNRYLGYQNNSKYVWCYYNMLNLTSGSDWIKTGNSWSSNGAITNVGRYVIQRYNVGTWQGELFDWITMSYTAPSYTKTSYTLHVVVEASRSNASNKTSRVRAVYYDYGTNYANWCSWGKTPDGKDYLRSAVDVGNSNWTLTDYGEKIAANVSYDGTYTKGSTEFTVTVDNSTGSAEATSNRYGGFLSTKTQTTSGGTYDHYSKLYMWYTNRTDTYYKHVTFNANGGTGTMSKQTVQTSANLIANKFTREGFTFAGWNTKADGTGTQYAAGANITATSSSKGPVTLYAQWTAQDIKATFDYTYRTSDVAGGAETYVHMPETVQSGENPFTKKVRVNLRNASGTVLWTGILTAPAATTPTGNITSSISTHKTAAITLKVVKGSGSTNTISTSGSTNTVTLTAANYTNYRSVDFEVMNADGTAKAAHWVSTKQNATNYIFKYEGHSSANMFTLNWRVNLKNLSMYPTDIFVKPMRKGTHTDNGGSITLEQIPAMTGIDGIECELAGYIDASGNNVTIDTYNAKSVEEKAEFNKTGGAYYTGEYNVLKTCAHAKDYNYQLGLTGFILDGITYYLAETEGNVPTDMISSAVASSTNANITFDRLNTDIPVLLLSPNVDGNENLSEDKRATVSGRANYKLYVDNHASRTVNLEQFEAVRPGYDFMGWKDAYDQTVYVYNGDYHFNMGTKATTSLLAQWERTNAPVIVVGGTVKNENNFIYNVAVTDEFNDIQSVKYIYTDTETEPAAGDQGWEDMTKSEGNYTLTIPMFNNYSGKHLWVKAANADKSSIISLGEVRSIYKLKANPNPASGKVEEYENGTWSEPTEEGGESTFNPDGTKTTVTYYDHYSTFYFSNRSFKVYDATVYTAKLVDGNKLELNKIEPTEEYAPVVIPQNTAVILRKVQTEVNDNIIELEECEGAEYSGETNSLEGTDDIDSHKAGKKYYIFSYAQKGLGFYLNNTTSLAAHKAYICLPDGESNNIRAFTLNFGEDDPITVAIHEIETTGKTSVTYDLSGRKVNDGGTHGGIYLKSGSKLLKK